MTGQTQIVAWVERARELLSMQRQQKEQNKLADLFKQVGVDLLDAQKDLLPLLAKSVNKATEQLLRNVAGDMLPAFAAEIDQLNQQLPPKETVDVEPVRRGDDMPKVAAKSSGILLEWWLKNIPLKTFVNVVLTTEETVEAWTDGFSEWVVGGGKGDAKSVIRHFYEKDHLIPLRNKVAQMKRGDAEQAMQAHRDNVEKLGPLNEEIAKRATEIEPNGRAAALVSEFGDRIKLALGLTAEPSVGDLKALEETLKNSRATLERLNQASPQDPTGALLDEDERQRAEREEMLRATRGKGAFEVRKRLQPMENAKDFAKKSNEELSKAKVIAGDDIEGLRKNLQVMFDQPVHPVTSARVGRVVDAARAETLDLTPEVLGKLKDLRMGGSATLKDQNTKVVPAKVNWEATDSYVTQLAADAKFETSPENLHEMILKVNGMLGKDIAEHPGELRVDVNAAAGFSTDSGDQFATRMYVPAVEVEREMQNLSRWLSAALAHGENPIEVAAKASQRIASIHPFHDGNGRTSRFVMDFVLQRSGLPPACLGEDVELAVFPRIAPSEMPSTTGAVNAIEAGVKKSYEALGAPLKVKPAPLQPLPMAPSTTKPPSKPAEAKAPEQMQFICLEHPEIVIEGPVGVAGPACPKCGGPTKRRPKGDMAEALKASDEEAFRKTAVLREGGFAEDPEKIKEQIGRRMDELKSAMKADTPNAQAIESLIKQVGQSLGAAKIGHGFTRYAATFDPDMLALERRHGANLIGIFNDNSVPLKNKMMLHAASAKNGNLLHNMVVGHLEEEIDAKDVAKRREQDEAAAKYTNCLRAMAKQHMADAGSSLGKDVDLSKEQAYLDENTALGRVLVQGNLAQDPMAALHPGFWGLFVMPPTSGGEAKATREGGGAYRRRVSDEPGVQLYNTEGNNRRMFQRINKDDGSSVTFSTKGGGMDMTVPLEKINKEFVQQYREMLDRMDDCTPEGVARLEQELKQMQEQEPERKTDIDVLSKKLERTRQDQANGTMHCFAINRGDPAHETVGFGHYSMAGQDFNNIKEKYDRVDALAQRAPEFASVKAGMVKPMFCTAMAKTQSNMKRLPADVQNWCKSKQEMPTQVVTGSASETSLRLDRGGNKQDQYRMRKDMHAEKPIYMEKFEAKPGVLVEKGQPLYTYREFDSETDLLALENADKELIRISDELVKLGEWVPQEARTEKVVYWCTGNVLKGNQHDRFEADKPGNCDICQEKLKTSRTQSVDQPVVTEKRTKRREELQAEQKKFTESKKQVAEKGRLQTKVAESDVRLGNTEQIDGAIHAGTAICDFIESGAEHEEFIRILQAQQKQAKITIGDEVYATKDGKKLTDAQRARVEAAYMMTHNLAGSLALFLEVGDTSANLGNSFDARNISNGTVRDEDEWGKGLVRLSDDGKRAVTWTNRDMEDCRESLMAIVRTMDVPPNSKLAEDVEKLQGSFNTLLSGLFQNKRKGTCHSFGEPPIAAQFESKLKSLEEGKLEEGEAGFWTAVKQSGVKFDQVKIVEDKLKDKPFSDLCGRFDPKVLEAAELGLDGTARDAAMRVLTSEDIVRGGGMLSSEVNLAAETEGGRVMTALKTALPEEKARLLLAKLQQTSGQDAEFVAHWSAAKTEFHTGLKTIMKEYMTEQVKDTAFAGLSKLFEAMSA